MLIKLKVCLFLFSDFFSLLCNFSRQLFGFDLNFTDKKFGEGAEGEFENVADTNRSDHSFAENGKIALFNKVKNGGTS